MFPANCVAHASAQRVLHTRRQWRRRRRHQWQQRCSWLKQQRMVHVAETHEPPHFSKGRRLGEEGASRELSLQPQAWRGRVDRERPSCCSDAVPYLPFQSADGEARKPRRKATPPQSRAGGRAPLRVSAGCDWQAATRGARSSCGRVAPGLSEPLRERCPPTGWQGFPTPCYTWPCASRPPPSSWQHPTSGQHPSWRIAPAAQLIGRLAPSGPHCSPSSPSS